MLLLQSSLIATQSHNLPTHFLFRLPLSITSNFVMRPFPPCTPLYYPLNTLFESFITPQPRNLNLRHSSFPFTYSVHSGLLPFLRRFTPRNEVVDMIPTSIFLRLPLSTTSIFVMRPSPSCTPYIPVYYHFCVASLLEMK